MKVIALYWPEILHVGRSNRHPNVSGLFVNDASFSFRLILSERLVRRTASEEDADLGALN